MCFEVFEFMDNAARCILGALCVCLCGGPVMIVIGAIFLVMNNTREDDINKYNAAVAAYRQSTGPLLSQTSMAVNSNSMTSSVEGIVVEGDSQGVDSGSHIVFTAASVGFPADNTYNFVVILPNNDAPPPVVPVTIPSTSRISADLTCEDALQSRTATCRTTTMSSYCSNRYNGTYQSFESSCSGREVCGTCTFQGSLSRACVVMSIQGTSARLSRRYTSCYYPFDKHQYELSSSSATILVMSEDDPFIVIQERTKGTNDFGASTSDRQTLGIVLIVIGSVIAVALSIALCLFIRSHMKKQEDDPDRYARTHRHHHHHRHSRTPSRHAHPAHVAHLQERPVLYGEYPNNAAGYAEYAPSPQAQSYPYGATPPAAAAMAYPYGASATPPHAAVYDPDGSSPPPYYARTQLPPGAEGSAAPLPGAVVSSENFGYQQPQRHAGPQHYPEALPIGADEDNRDVVPASADDRRGGGVTVRVPPSDDAPYGEAAYEDPVKPHR